MANPIIPRILNIASGKINPIGLDEYNRYFLLNLDTMYFQALTAKEAEISYELWSKSATLNLICNHDAFEFMERTSIMFDRIVCYRFLEHVKRTDVLYFIYLISTCLKVGGIFDCIVPNYELLAKMILSEDLPDEYFEQRDILLTTELLNEPGSPHASVWTPQRVEYFLTLEQRFRVKEIDSQFDFDGRDIYIRFLAERIERNSELRK